MVLILLKQESINHPLRNQNITILRAVLRVIGGPTSILRIKGLN
jgi:hypothetical protein